MLSALLCAPPQKAAAKKKPHPERDAASNCYLSTEAIAAVDRTVVARLERNFARLATFGAHSVEHFAGTAVTTTGITLAGVAAGLAALRLIGETLFSEKLLLAGGECELLPAIFADDNFVLEHVIPL